MFKISDLSLVETNPSIVLRNAMMLEDQEDAVMDIVEVDDELAIKTCKHYNYKYAVITPNDIVIPPKNDKLQKD